jgi:superfamily II DNA/RNA helicase
MLDMGFIPDIERIFKLTPPKKQTLFFSATMPPEITRLTKQFLNDPVRIVVARPATTAETISQHIVRVPAADPAIKRLALRAVITAEEIKNAIVFCNRKSDVDIVAKSLKKHGLDASPIHGDLDQATRMRTLDAFRRGELRLLVASDVAARGLDIPDVSHVLNYDVPHHADDYVHRIGRTGRAGKSGRSVMIVSPADGRSLDKVLKLTGKAPDELKLDVDWSEAKSRGEARPRRPERHSRSERSYGRPASETSVAAMEPLQPKPAAEATEEAPRRERAPRPKPESRPRETASAARSEPRPAARQDAPRDRSEPRPAARHDAPKDRSEPRPAAREGASRHKPEPRPAAREGGDDLGPSVKGFGADVPAFLARAIPVSAED